MKTTYFIAFLLLFGACSKAKIKDTCENNSVDITPKNYNQDSAIFHMVSAFTPNGDNLNDDFKALIYGVTLKEFKVCKRSKVLFSTTDNNTHWDGTDKDGKPCKDGVYQYEITAANTTDGDFKICGDVSLITEDKNQNCLCKYEDQIDPSRGFIAHSQETCDGH